MEKPFGRIPRVALVLLVLVGFLVVRLAASFLQARETFRQEDALLARFAPAIETYLALAESPKAKGDPSLRGKLVTIDVDKRAVDSWTHFKLPEALRAESPDEVGTIALVKWGWRHEGSYLTQDTGEKVGEAYTGVGAVTLIDLASRTIVGQRSFEGDPPAGGLRRVGDYRSERPMFAIVDYLARLPRN
jgi:hypothetical protein